MHGKNKSLDEENHLQRSLQKNTLNDRFVSFVYFFFFSYFVFFSIFGVIPFICLFILNLRKDDPTDYWIKSYNK